MAQNTITALCQIKYPPMQATFKGGATTPRSNSGVLHQEEGMSRVGDTTHYM